MLSIGTASTRAEVIHESHPASASKEGHGFALRVGELKMIKNPADNLWITKGLTNVTSPRRYWTIIILLERLGV
jgi:hypothetical protein